MEPGIILQIKEFQREPVIGLEFILEIVRQNEVIVSISVGFQFCRENFMRLMFWFFFKENKYRCELCKKELLKNKVIEHIVSNQHRLSYLVKYHSIISN